MPRTIFEQELTTLQDDLLLMGSMVEKAVAKPWTLLGGATCRPPAKWYGTTTSLTTSKLR